MPKTLTIATVLKPQGIRGEIKVKALTDSAEDLKNFPRVFIDGVEYKVLSVRPAGDCAFLSLRGIADRNAAELLRGKHQSRSRRNLAEGADDEFPCEYEADENRPCDIAPVAEQSENILRRQHQHEGRRHQHFIGDRVKKFPEIGDQPAGTGNASVQKIGERGRRKNHRRNK